MKVIITSTYTLTENQYNEGELSELVSKVKNGSFQREINEDSKGNFNKFKSTVEITDK